MRGNIFTTLLLGGVLGLFVASCTESQNPLEQTPEDGPANVAALFALNESQLGMCMGNDAFNGGLTGGMGAPEDLNCTANDIYLARALPTRYSAVDPEGDPDVGDPLAPDQAIPCAAGSSFWVYTSAEVANNAQQRWDVGVWIATDGGIQAITGQCDHFTLTIGEPGVSDFDADYCGDMAAAKQVDTVTELDLEWIEVQCEVTKEVEGVGYAEVGACVGWQNSANKNVEERFCPFPSPVGTGTEADWRVATTPETKSKCNCEPLLIPVDPQGTLTIVKETVPEDDTDQQFTFTPGGWNSDADFYLIDGQSKTSEFLSASTYTVTETVPAGWDLTNRACVYNDTGDPKAFTPTANGVSVALGSGEHVTCTFTNTKRANITIKKVTNPAESPPVGSFTFTQTIDGSGDFVLQHDGTKLFEHIVPGVAKTVVESDPTPQYDLTGITCEGESDYTATLGTRTLSVTPKPGEEIVCTFTNTARKPKLKLVKTVVNAYGGTATAADFQAYLGGGEKEWDTWLVLDPGSYTASESSLYGYTAGDWGGDCATDGSVTLALGDEKTCTITNSDIQPKLTLVKTVVNNYGGTLGVADFPLFIGATPAISGTAYGLNAGTYTASETEQFGYTASAWGTDCAADGSVTLAVGEEKTCTITNSDIQPKLKLIKYVEGGTLTVADFPLFVTPLGGDPAMGDATSVNSGDWNGFDAGDWVASETSQSGYTAGDWGGDCATDGGVTLAVGDEKTCTITNTYVPQETETAYAMGDPSICFLDNDFSQWGWTNGPINEGTYTWPVYAGASGCNATLENYVGDVTVTYNGGNVTVEFVGFTPESYAVYAGYAQFPTGPSGNLTVAPGQYTNPGGFSGEIYVIIHAVVIMPAG